MIRENSINVASGWAMLVALPVLILVNSYGLFVVAATGQVPILVLGVLTLVTLLVCLGGFFIVNPNESKVIQLFGRYVGTVHEPRFRWANPFYSKTKVSKRVRNFDSDRLKVNDRVGNPVEIAAVVVWRVVDTAQAVFEVDNFVHYVQVQSEAAVRNLATRYSYDDHEEGEISLRENTTEVADRLKEEIQERLSSAGVEVIEARISHLAYAPEIASAMLQRQQAGAVIAARRRIVDGAVGMVQMALEQLEGDQIVRLDEERKAAMVSNLLVVLCSDRATQPIVNTGTLHN